MKKSEMIKALENEYRDFLDNIDLNELLKFLERKGMLPPEYETFVEYSNQFVPRGRYYEKVTKREWEPE